MSKIPENFTGIAEYPPGSKVWYKEGKRHKEDGPACEYANGYKSWFREDEWHREDGPAREWPDGKKEWWINGHQFYQINLKDFLILEYSKGEYGLMWYRLLDKDEILEYPDIPGLITK